MKFKKLSLWELVQLCLASQDPEPWLEFVSRVQPMISGVVAKSLRRWSISDPALVDDLTQDTFLKLCDRNFRALREFHFEHEYLLYGFLKRIAINVVHDHIRKARPWDPEPEDLDSITPIVPVKPGPGEDPHTQILMAEIQRCLEEALQNQPNCRRDLTIFWLYYRGGLTAKDISRLSSIGLSVKGVESTLLRLTRLLRGRLGGGSDE